MITGFFLTLVYGVAHYLIDHLPTTPYPTQITAAIAWFWAAVNNYSYVSPVSTFVVLIALTAIADGAYFVWVFFHWVLRRFKH